MALLLYSKDGTQPLPHIRPSSLSSTFVTSATECLMDSSSFRFYGLMSSVNMQVTECTDIGTPQSFCCSVHAMHTPFLKANPLLSTVYGKVGWPHSVNASMCKLDALSIGGAKVYVVIRVNFFLR